MRNEKLGRKVSGNGRGKVKGNSQGEREEKERKGSKRNQIRHGTRLLICIHVYAATTCSTREVVHRDDSNCVTAIDELILSLLTCNCGASVYIYYIYKPGTICPRPPFPKDVRLAIAIAYVGNPIGGCCCCCCCCRCCCRC